MREGQATVIRREDYTAPAYWIETVDLTFDLDPAKTRVLNKMRVRRNPDVTEQALRLDGEDLNLARVLVNGQGTSFKLDGGRLVLENLPTGPEAFDLEIFTTCSPEKNTRLMGLYVSNGSFFTQCEAEGFRRITYFLDRPDVLSVYTVRLEAARAEAPVLLSNGNLGETGAVEGVLDLGFDLGLLAAAGAVAVGSRSIGLRPSSCASLMRNRPRIVRRFSDWSLSSWA